MAYDGGPFRWRVWRIAWARGPYDEVSSVNHRWIRIIGRLWFGFRKKLAA